MAKDLQPRLRGRPETGADAGNLRERLVDAGRELFAMRGYAATSLRQVSLRAGVTPALVHYYFKDKAGLFDAAMRERVAPLIRAIETALAGQQDDAVAALARFVQQFTLVSSRHPWLPQLLLRELADDADPEQQVMRPLVGKLQALVAAGQASNAIRADLRAESIVLSVLSLCAFPFLAGGVLRREMRIAADVGAAPGMTLHHLAVLQDGLRPRARDQSPRHDPSS